MSLCLLENIENNCYLNTILQIFLTDKDFISKLSTIEGNQYSIINNLIIILNKLTTNSISIKRLIEYKYNYYKGNNLQDAHETFIILLDLLEKENKSLVKDLYHGISLSKYICSSCGHSFNTSDDFYDLTIGLINDDLMSCLKNNFIQYIDDYKCDHCGNICKHLKKMYINKYPKRLIIVLNRYTSHGKKNNISVPYVYHLKFTESLNNNVNNNTNYYLSKIIYHVGSGSNNGHYCIDVLTSTDWIFIDDNITNRHHNLMNNHNSYMLVYNLID